MNRGGVARQCAEEGLNQLRAGCFSLEQRYRYDRQTGRKKLVGAEEEQALVDSGNGGELRGTLKPDVVIHRGDPLDAEAVYDFKFPCKNTDHPPEWNEYPEGHPYHRSNQGDMYEELFGVPAARVVPRLEVIR